MKKLVKENIGFERGMDPKKGLDVGAYSTSQIPTYERDFLGYISDFYSSDGDDPIVSIFKNKLNDDQILEFWIRYKEDLKSAGEEVGYDTPDREKFRDYMLYNLGITELRYLEFSNFLISIIKNIRISESDFKSMIDSYHEIRKSYKKYLNIKYDLEDRQEDGEIIDQNKIDEIDNHVYFLSKSRKEKTNQLKKIAEKNSNLRHIYDENFPFNLWPDAIS